MNVAKENKSATKKFHRHFTLSSASLAPRRTHSLLLRFHTRAPLALRNSTWFRAEPGLKIAAPILFAMVPFTYLFINISTHKSAMPNRIERSRSAIMRRLRGPFDFRNPRLYTFAQP